jgi:hypothetical protein
MRIVELLKRVHGEETEQILNVSAEFMAYGNCLGPSPVMSLEGMYNAENGRMYLIGCQKRPCPTAAAPVDEQRPWRRNGLFHRGDGGVPADS